MFDLEGGKRHKRGSRAHKRGTRKHRRTSRKGGNLTSAILPFGLLGLQKVVHSTKRTNKTRKSTRRNRRR